MSQPFLGKSIDHADCLNGISVEKNEGCKTFGVLRMLNK